jgi:outer membrane protein OmpA-like peptidoglycan-associated protein
MKKESALLYIIAVLSIFVFSVSARGQSHLGNSENLDEFAGETKNMSRDNWFISVGTGINLLWGEQDQEIAGIPDRLKLGGGNLTLGKWFNPYFGLRLQGIYAPLKGYNYLQPLGPDAYYVHPGSPNQKAVTPVNFIVPGNVPYIGDIDYWSRPDYFHDVIYSKDNWRNFELVRAKNGADAFVQDFTYWSFTFDLMMNLVPLFRGYYKEGNTLDIIPFIGGGLIRAQASNSTVNFTYGVFKAGIRPSYNINSKLAIFAEAQGNITSREFDAYIGDELFDMIFHLNVGLQYTFNRNFVTPSGGRGFLTSEEVNYLNEKINNNRNLIDKHQNILERQQDLLDKLNNCCDENTGERATVTHIYQGGGYLPEYIRFALNSAQIQFTEDSKFKDVVEFLNTNPNSKLLLIGYADKKTGTSRYNFELSKKRVEAVSQELIRRGIDAQRLILEWKGDEEQPYEANEWNRVVVMVERN